MPGMEIIQVPVLSDNYVYVLRDVQSGKTAVVDPAVAQPILSVLNERDWKLDYILNTHHHADHTGGNRELKMVHHCQVVGADHDADRILGIDIRLKEGEAFHLGELEAAVIGVPGHTTGHIAYWFAGADALFCGDTLFSLGCGRLFEGTPAQMWTSLRRIRDLPETTQIYCAHEYTLNNGEFALTVEPNNQDLKARVSQVRKLRRDGRPTVPSVLGEERRCNPFLRADRPEFQGAMGMLGADPVSVFAEVRRRKDVF